jgi:hypothetical protein
MRNKRKGRPSPKDPVAWQAHLQRLKELKDDRALERALRDQAEIEEQTRMTRLHVEMSRLAKKLGSRYQIEECLEFHLLPEDVADFLKDAAEYPLMGGNLYTPPPPDPYLAPGDGNLSQSHWLIMRAMTIGYDAHGRLRRDLRQPFFLGVLPGFDEVCGKKQFCHLSQGEEGMTIVRFISAFDKKVFLPFLQKRNQLAAWKKWTRQSRWYEINKMPSSFPGRLQRRIFWLPQGIDILIDDAETSPSGIRWVSLITEGSGSLTPGSRRLVPSFDKWIAPKTRGRPMKDVADD